MIEKDYIISIFSIIASIFILTDWRRYLYGGIIKRDLKIRTIYGIRKWTGVPALIVALFNLLLAILLIIIPLYFIIKDIFF